MSRLSANQVVDGIVMNGYDYDKQAWIINGVYQDCGHPRTMGEKCCNAHQLRGQPSQTGESR